MPSPWQTLAFGSELTSPLWELFHENTKYHQFSYGTSDEEVAEHMANLHESLPFDGFPTILLPDRLPPLTMAVDQAMKSRVSSRAMRPGSLSIGQLTAILHYGYGVTRNLNNTSMPGGLRVTPSAGALYPLEIFIYVSKVKRLAGGLYHYNPVKHHLRRLRDGVKSKELDGCFIPETVPKHCSVLIFVTALFARSTFKYGNRGYRFVCMEAGHVAQNMSLVCSAFKLGCLNIGGFYDRKIDSFLGLDGIAHSTLYLLAVGSQRQKPANQRG